MGVYIPRYRLALVREGRQPAATRVIANPRDVADILQAEIGDADREIFCVVLLDTRNTMIGLHQVSIGSLNASLVHPRETLKAALLSNAAAIMLAHNHPSGDLAPSAEDLAVTTRLKQAGELLGIPVLDHLIISGEQFLSLKECGPW